MIASGIVYGFIFIGIWLNGEFVGIENNKSVLVGEIIMSVGIIIFGVYNICKLRKE